MFSFGIKDIIDILIVALLLYTLYKMMKESGTISIFTGVLAFVGVWIVVKQILDMRLIGSIMDKFMSVGLLILVILFQDEIKRFLVQLGSHKRWRFFFNFFLKHKDQGEKPYIIPVSSDTTMASASVTSVMPSAERWRSPIDLGILLLCDTGRMQAAAARRLSAMMRAPSCRGLFLKKMFSIRRAFTSAQNISPVCS